MTNPGLAKMDALIHKQLARAGLAEKPTSCTYTAAEGDTPIPCAIYIDRAMQFVGDVGPVAGARVVIGILRAYVPAPVTGARVVTGSETFKLEGQETSSDESISRWVVGNG